MTLRARAEAWLASRAPRERRLLALAATAMLAMVASAVVGAAHDDLAALRARVAAHERELGEVRRLAAALQRRPPARADTPEDDVSILGRLEAVAAETVGRERIASMTPAVAPGDGPRAGVVALRVAGASLAEVVHLLHGLDTASPPVAVHRLELRKHPDDATRFDTTVEVVR